MQYNLSEDGSYKLCSTPICNKYRLTVNGKGEFISKQALLEVISDAKLNFDVNLLESTSKNILIWNLDRLENCTNITAFFNINETICGASVNIHPSNLTVILEEEIGGISGMKIKKDICSLLKADEVCSKEIDRVNLTLEGRVYDALRSRIGDISVLTDSISFICNNGVHEAMVPIAIADNDYCSPAVVGKITISDDIIDTSDIENKVGYMFLDEAKLDKFNERLKKRVRINYRKNKNNGESLKKDIKNIGNSVLKNNGHQ